MRDNLLFLYFSTEMSSVDNYRKELSKSAKIFIRVSEAALHFVWGCGEFCVCVYYFFGLLTLVNVLRVLYRLTVPRGSFPSVLLFTMF